VETTDLAVRDSSDSEAARSYGHRRGHRRSFHAPLPPPRRRSLASRFAMDFLLFLVLVSLCFAAIKL